MPAAAGDLLWHAILASAEEPVDPMEKAFHSHAGQLRASRIAAGPLWLLKTYGLRQGLPAMTNVTLAQRLRKAEIFARIMPEEKLRIVEALKAAGHVVVMTGHGVNDAPSLKAAHIGVAMGGRGTDVARQASAIVLLDDDFGSIVKAIRLGRRIHDNLRKAIGFIFAVHFPIAALAVLPLLFGLPIILAPVHIAFLEMVIDPVCTLVFEAEDEEADIMKRPPRPPDERLFSRRLIGIAHSITLAGASLGYLSLPQEPVEAVIALSIAFVASELVKSRQEESRLSEKYPWVVVFSLELLHGFGFAGALREIGLPQTDVSLALLAFNLGVEAGQLLFVAVIAASIAVTKFIVTVQHAIAPIGIAYVIGTVSTIWFAERLISIAMT